MIDWFTIFNWIIVMLFIGFLFIKYRNNFYLWNYLKNFSIVFKFIDKLCFYITEVFKLSKLKKEYFNLVVDMFKNLIFLICILLNKVFEIILDLSFIVYFYITLSYIILILIDVVVKIYQNIVILIKVIGNIPKNPKIVTMIFFITIFFLWYICNINTPIIIIGFCLLLLLVLRIFVNLYNVKESIVILFVMTTSGISVFSWFQKFNIALLILFVEFLFLIYILYFFKILLLIKKIKYTLLINFVLSFICIICIINFEGNTNAIRITKGKLKDLKGGRIALFLENNKKLFPIKIDDNKLYIENDSLFIKNYKIIKTLFNKENNISLVAEQIPSESTLSLPLPNNYDEIFKIKQGKFLFINNENSRILDNNGKEINEKMSIEGKIVVIENNPNNYIFIGNNLGWSYLDKKEIEIEEDNFYINLLNLALFLSSIIYFWLKLYGKKSLEYYDKETINKIKETPILLDRNKYDKFLTLSMFGLTIPNIWKIVTTKSVGEMNSSIWIKIDIMYLFIFSIVLFCLITSKEISECIKELENEKK